MGAIVIALPSNPDHWVTVPEYPASKMHVTLAYIGSDTPDYEMILEDAEIRLSSFRAWPAHATVTEAALLGNDEPRASVLLLSDEWLLPLMQQVREHLPWLPPSDYPNYKPHLTVGYGIPPNPHHLGHQIMLDRIALWKGNDDGPWWPLLG